jgi:alkanesulfonate monooxygenase
LVGSYDEVRSAILKYIQEGFRTFILDVPPSREELHHTTTVFDSLSDAAPIMQLAAQAR